MPGHRQPYIAKGLQSLQRDNTTRDVLALTQTSLGVGVIPLAIQKGSVLSSAFAGDVLGCSHEDSRGRDWSRPLLRRPHLDSHLSTTASRTHPLLLSLDLTLPFEKKPGATNRSRAHGGREKKAPKTKNTTRKTILEPCPKFRSLIPDSQIQVLKTKNQKQAASIWDVDCRYKPSGLIRCTMLRCIHT
jgi:hypothetical protein